MPAPGVLLGSVHGLPPTVTPAGRVRETVPRDQPPLPVARGTRPRPRPLDRMAGMSTPRTNADRRQAAALRTWAAENGYELAPAGRIPAPVRAAYEAAQAAGPGDQDDQGDPPDGDPPDGDPDELGESGGQWDDELSLSGPASPPPDGDQDAESGPEADAPPATLAEARERVSGPQDTGGGRSGRPRPPSWATAADKAGDRAGPGIASPVKITKAVRDDVAGKLTLMLTFPVMAWQTVDPLCGGEAADRLDRIVQTAVPLICQSPDAVKMFTKGTTYMLWLEFLMAITPVAGTVYQHHIAHTIELVEAPADGQDPAANGHPGHHPGPDLSAQYPPVATGHIPVPRPG